LFIKNLLLRDLRENELIGPIPPILGNLSYTGKLLVSSTILFTPKPSSFSLINGLYNHSFSAIYMATNLLDTYHQNWGT
jgi:hypothetical protein